MTGMVGATATLPPPAPQLGFLSGQAPPNSVAKTLTLPPPGREFGFGPQKNSQTAAIRQRLLAVRPQHGQILPKCPGGASARTGS